jgi:phosphate butyryltransferase
MINDFNDLMNRAGQKDKKFLAVAAAGEEEVLQAIKLALERSLISPVLVGNIKKIKQTAAEIDLDMKQVELIAVNNKSEACHKAVCLVNSGKADILMKGLVDTSKIMKAVLDEEYGLTTSRLISHIAMVESSALNKLVFITDGGMNIKPNLEEKKQIIENAVGMAHKLGYKKPSVAILAAVEKVNYKMKETLDAAALSKMGDRGQIEGAVIDGPLALDNALSEEAAEIKGIESPVAGKADILLVPEIIAGNLLGKSPVYFAEDEIATIIGGTSHSIVLTSRANTAQIKLVSIAAAVLLADY